MMMRKVRSPLFPLFSCQRDDFNDDGDDKNNNGCDHIPTMQCKQDEVEDNTERQQNTLAQGMPHSSAVQARRNETQPDNIGNRRKCADKSHFQQHKESYKSLHTLRRHIASENDYAGPCEKGHYKQ